MTGSLDCVRNSVSKVPISDTRSSLSGTWLTQNESLNENQDPKGDVQAQGCPALRGRLPALAHPSARLPSNAARSTGRLSHEVGVVVRSNACELSAQLRRKPVTPNTAARGWVLRCQTPPTGL